MTYLGAFDTATPPAPVEQERALKLSPAEGWSTFAALIVLLLAAAFAIDDANWAGHVAGTDGRQTAFLPLAVVLAAVCGFVLAKSGLPTLASHLIGASLGAAYLLVAVSGAVSRSSVLEQRLRDLGLSVSTFVDQVVGEGIRSSETSVFLLVLGAFVWAAGQVAAYTVFRRHRPVPAITVASALLLLNMSITLREQYAHLVVLAAASLWLVMRLNLLQQSEGWRSRRIADGGYVSGLFMRSGAVFVALAIVSSLTLAANASSAPLARAWRDMDEQLLEVGYAITRWVGGVSGPARGPSHLFAPSQTIRDVWESSTQLVFTAVTSDGRGHYWRGATYDAFDGRTWQQTDRHASPVAAGEELLAGTVEQLEPGRDRREVVATITAVDMAGDVLVAPEAPHRLDRPAELLTHDVGGNFVSARVADGLEDGGSVTVASFVRKGRGEAGAITGNQLAAAGVAYPTWAARYTEVRPGSVGPRVYSQTQRIVSRLPADRRDPYHVAVAIQNFLFRDGGFHYSTDVRGLCAGENLVDCFLRVRTGYCEYFATTMVMMLRTQQIPARYTLGYLPGQLADGTWNVDRSAAHAWVEVYFPDYGWVRFDPTPGNRQNGQAPTRLDPGAAVATPRPVEAPAQTPSFDRRPELDPESGQGAPPPGPRPDVPGGGDGTGSASGVLGPTALIVIGLVLLGLLVVTRLRRLPQTQPELAYRSVTRIAARFGHGPLPTQTAYEFADGLGELVPAVRGDLRTVATAKVESAYARRQPEGEALRGLREAYARVRFGLLRLLVRWPHRPRGPRST